MGGRMQQYNNEGRKGTNSCFGGKYTIAVHQAGGVFSKSKQNKMIKYMH